MKSTLARLERAIVGCERCPELRSYCAEVARTKRAAYRAETYWGKPVPGFGDPLATIHIVGLAPGAHGANRTGRVFTGDRSGDFLYAALHRAGLANQPVATHRGDGLELNGVWIGAACRCAPPANRPTPHQLQRCRSHLSAEITALKRVRIRICLGAMAWNSLLHAVSPRPRFAHGAQSTFAGKPVLGCYHVSQQNTFTGRLTPKMLDSLLERAVDLSRQ